MSDVDTSDTYRTAWEDWRKQIEHLHRVLLEGEPIQPAQMKGLLGREARAKEAYDRARERLLGLAQDTLDPPPDGSNPFR